MDEERRGREPDEVAENDAEDDVEEDVEDEDETEGSWEGLTGGLSEEDEDGSEGPESAAGRWRPTWALVLAVSFAALQVLGVLSGLALVVFDLLHDSPTYDGVAAGVGAYLVGVFTLTAAAWAFYLARPTVRTFVVAAASLVVVPALGYLVLGVLNG